MAEPPRTVSELARGQIGFEALILMEKEWSNGDRFISLETGQLVTDGNGGTEFRRQKSVSLPSSPATANFLRKASEALLERYKGTVDQKQTTIPPK